MISPASCVMMASWSGKCYTKRHHVDRAYDEDLQDIKFGWMTNYNQRGLAVRIVCPPNTKDEIGHVKFLTREVEIDKATHYSWIDTNEYTFEEFKDHVKSDVKEFEWPKLPGKPWDEINAFMEEMQFRYEKIDGIEQWQNVWSLGIREKIKVSAEVECYIADFISAMKTDFENGEAKEWLKSLVEMLMESDDLSEWRVKCQAPPLHSKTNVYLETIIGYIENEATMDKFNASFECPTLNSCSSDMSVLSLDRLSITSLGDHSQIKSEFVVPDLFVALPEHPGVFPLVVEMKPGRYRSEGEFQNIKQMLTKMFYQDVIFGLVITSRGYRMSFIRKNTDTLHYSSTRFQYFTDKRKSHDNKLEISRLDQLYSFIYGILKWSRKTKCILPTVSMNDSVSKET